MKSLLVVSSLLIGLAPAAAAQSFDPGRDLGVSAIGFGASIAIGDGEIFIGRTGGGVAGAIYPAPGGVHVFERGATGWVATQHVTPPDVAIGDGFGAALGVLGSRLLVGSPGRDDGRGGAFLFERGADGRWSQAALLEPAGPAVAGAGAAVALLQAGAVLGAPTTTGPGSVVVFTQQEGQTVVLQAPAAADGDRYGASVAVSDGRLFVGAPGTSEGTGAVYVYTPASTPGTWTLTTTLEPAGEDGAISFGAALSTHSGILLVGAPSGRSGAGAVFAYHNEPGSEEWTPGSVLALPDETSGQYGSSLALDGSAAVIGAMTVAQGSGAARLYDVGARPEAWSDGTSIDPAEFGPGAFFGSAVALREGVAVVAAANADLRMGAAAVFERQGSRWVETSVLRETTRTLEAMTGEEVACADGSTGPFDCSQVDLVAFVPMAALGAGPGTIINDIWGWTDPETGKEWALVGRSDATAFVDISNPSAPRYVGQLPLSEGASANLWRDIKVYEDHAFIVADGAGAHGMQVFDLAQLRDVVGDPVTFEETAHYDGIHSAHNVVINEETGMAYAVGSSMGGQTCGGGLHMIDIRDPRNPTFAGCFSDRSTGRQRTGYSHDAQCVIYRGPDEDYQGREVCFGANETALSIADVSDRENPVAIARGEYPNVGYTHQGWLTEDHRYFLMGDEADEVAGVVDRTRTLIWDVADLDDPLLLKEYFAETGTIDHNLYIRGNRAYQANLMSGLRILDISDIENPVEIGFFDTVPDDPGLPAFGGAWSNYPFFESGVVIVSSWSEGLFLLRPRGTPVS